MAPLNILIVGCSIAGPALATFLLLSTLPTSEKPRITILERSSALRTQGQNIDIRGVGVTMIRKLGLEAVIRASSTGEEGVRWVTKDNRVWASHPAGNDGELHTPTSGIEIMRGRLADICLKRSKALRDEVEQEGGTGIKYIFGDYLDELDQQEDDDGMQQVHVRFAKSGDRRTYDVVIGADGLHSQTRKMAWGIEGETDRVKRLDMFGAFFSIPPEKTDTTWRRCFHTTGRRLIMLRPDVQSGRTTAFLSVVNAKDRRLAAVAADGSHGPDALAAQKALIKGYFHDAGWESERILREMTAAEDFYYEVVAQVKMDKWSKGRVVLVGDAAYCASPLSGMGATLALYGAYNLAGALTRHPQDPGAAFAEYEERMRAAVGEAQKLVPGQLRIMNPETAWGVWFVDALVRLLVWSRLLNLLFKLKGQKKESVHVEEYGLRELPEWTE
ncbi:oxidoreductase [Podospora didyma]|uniref:Oxidoreductase n=1 Tax=Podospora didyma TaxID=330526 RepID=A0AAE0U1F2_9PEZI|nr:oxidoreductase [Podospora didyma]